MGRNKIKEDAVSLYDRERTSMNKTNESSRIKSVQFEYVGTDEQFVNFLKCVFRDYITGCKVASDEQNGFVRTSSI